MLVSNWGHAKDERIAVAWQVVISALTTEWLPEWVDSNRHPLHRPLCYSLHHPHALKRCFLTEISEDGRRGTSVTQQLQGWYPGRIGSKTCTTQKLSDPEI